MTDPLRSFHLASATAGDGPWAQPQFGVDRLLRNRTDQSVESVDKTAGIKGSDTTRIRMSGDSTLAHAIVPPAESTITNVNACLICERVPLAKEGRNPHLIAEMDHSYFVVGDHQFHQGYALVLLKEHVREPFELSPHVQREHFREVMRAAEALKRHVPALEAEFLVLRERGATHALAHRSEV